MLSYLKELSKKVKREISIYRLILKDTKTPFISRCFLGLALGYLMLPFDLIPDFIPVLGQLDDIVIIPFLVYVAMKFVPQHIYENAKKRASKRS